MKVTVEVQEIPSSIVYPYSISLNVEFPDFVIYKEKKYFYDNKSGVDFGTSTIPLAYYKNNQNEYIWLNIQGRIIED